MLTVKDINKIEDPIERRKLKIQIIQRHQRKELKQVRTKYFPFVATPIFTMFGDSANEEMVGDAIKITKFHIKMELISFIFEVIKCFNKSLLQGNVRFPTKTF